MGPTFTPQNVVDGLEADAVLFGESTLRDVPTAMPTANVPDLARCQNRHVIFLSALVAVAALGGAGSVVLCLGAEPEMGRAHASPVVFAGTIVEHAQASRHRTVVNLPADVGGVNLPFSFGDPDFPIAVAAQGADPNPAASGLADFLPKTLSKWAARLAGSAGEAATGALPTVDLIALGVEGFAARLAAALNISLGHDHLLTRGGYRSGLAGS